MSPKIKLLFAVLAITAGLSLRNFYNHFDLTATVGGHLSTTPKSLPLPDNDFDHDGLDDTEESRWGTNWQNPDSDGDGFKDGEEVTSGHDPNKPGPNDFLNQSNNLTEKAISLSAGGIATGDLDPQNIQYSKYLAELSQALILDFTKSQPTTFNVTVAKEAETKTNQEAYLASISYVIQETFFSKPTTPNITQSILEQKNFLTTQRSHYQSAFMQLQKLAIPASWRAIHIRILSTLKHLEINYGYLSESVEDPLKMVLALGEIEKVNAANKELLKDISAQIEKNELTPSAEFYDLLKLLYQ